VQTKSFWVLLGLHFAVVSFAFDYFISEDFGPWKMANGTAHPTTWHAKMGATMQLIFWLTAASARCSV
jgi:hypothetical protein